MTNNYELWKSFNSQKQIQCQFTSKKFSNKSCCRKLLRVTRLSVLELIHLFVEVLDGYFGNVCELDLVFHFDKVGFLSEYAKILTLFYTPFGWVRFYCCKCLFLKTFFDLVFVRHQMQPPPNYFKNAGLQCVGRGRARWRSLWDLLHQPDRKITRRRKTAMKWPSFK